MKKLRLIGLLVVMGMVAVACSPDESAPTTTGDPGQTTTVPDDTTTTAPDDNGEVEYDIGVTPAPCDDAVNEGNGCIYLGIISDLVDGPFAELGRPLTTAQEHFWAAVNDDGGLGGFDVIIRSEDIHDAGYNPARHANAYAALGDRVLALAQSLGTPQTQAVLNEMDNDDMVAAPATWWSGWNFEEEDRGLILESGASYCFEAMNGLTFMSAAMAQAGFEDLTWGIIYFDGDYGEDYRAGALIAASQLGLGDPVVDFEQVPFSVEGTPDGAVAAVMANRPDLLIFVTGPREMATITGGVYTQGHEQFQVLGASPTWNVAFLDNPELMPLLEGVYKGTIPWGPWDSDTAGHAAMRAAAEANGHDPSNAYVAGWLWQYPIKSLLEQAIASGDMTRANVREIAGSLEGVDYQGMLPTRSYAGSPDDNAVRHSLIIEATSETADGVTVISPEDFVSPIVEAFPYEGPCFTN